MTKSCLSRLLALATISLASVAAAQEGAPAGEPPPQQRRGEAGPVRRLIENIRHRLLPARDARAAARKDVEHNLVVLRLSEDLFTSFVDRDVDELTPVQDVILQTPVVGTARTTGRPWVDLVPHDSQAAFEVVFEGTTVSRTVGRNGPAVIYSRTTTQFRATKQVLFDPGRGFYALPAEVQANTQLVTEGIGTTTRCRLISRLVRRRAWREVQAKHGEALAIVHGKAEHRVRSVFNEQLEKGLARLNRASDLRGTTVALLAAASEPRYMCCSTDRYVQIAASAGQRDALTIVLPAADHLGSPIQVWIHQSLGGPQIASTLTRLDRGRTGIRELARFSQSAAAALVGVELAAMANGSGSEPPAVDFTTVEDWIVIEIAQEGSSAAKALLPLRR
jgi:hypothetical protein